MQQEFAPKGVVFVGVNVAVRTVDGTLKADSEEEVKRYMAEHGWTFANGRDTDQKLVTAFNVAATPTTFFITSGGEILGRHVGAFQEDALREALQNLLDYKRP